MSYVWNTIGLDNPKIQLVDAFPTLDEVLEDMALLAWEDPSNRLVDFITDDDLGIVVAVAIFGPDSELIITVSDGRVIRHPMPEQYRE